MNKKCSTCQEKKSLDNFYFIIKTGKYKSVCKECTLVKYGNKSYDPDKSIRKICNGMICRGEKTFKSFNGKRYCNSCLSAMKNMSDIL